MPIVLLFFNLQILSAVLSFDAHAVRQHMKIEYRVCLLACIEMRIGRMLFSVVCVRVFVCASMWNSC